jgi:hypothetical protein
MEAMSMFDSSVGQSSIDSCDCVCDCDCDCDCDAVGYELLDCHDTSDDDFGPDSEP